MEERQKAGRYGLLITLLIIEQTGGRAQNISSHELQPTTIGMNTVSDHSTATYISTDNKTPAQSQNQIDTATEVYEIEGLAMRKLVDKHKTAPANESSPFSPEYLERMRSFLPPEAALFQDLMINYDKNTRPVMNASHIVDIHLAFTFVQVLGVEEKQQSLSVILWMKHYWRDEKLVWNPALYENITEIKLPSDKIWLPDIVLYNTAEKKIIAPQKRSRQIKAYLRHTGHIYWSPVMKYICSCNIELTYFPFDDQICFLKLGSWAYDGFQVNIWNNASELDLTQYTENSEFKLINTSIRRYITKYQCCIQPYPDVKVYLHIRRQTIQHVFNIVIPCIVLSIICMVGFLIPPDKNDEKISVQLTVLFSLSLFMLLVAESTPQTSEAVPLISVYLTALMSITAMSTTAHVVCDKLVASTKVRNEVPYLANKLLFQLVKCCRHRVADEEEDSQSDTYIELTESLNTQTTNGKPSLSRWDTETGQSSPNTTSTAVFSNGRRHTIPHQPNNDTTGEPNPKQKKPAGRRGIKQEHEQGLEGLFHHLKLRQEKMHSELQETSNWYQVAARMDKCFFWAYGISVLILTMYAYIFKPMQKNIEL